MDFETTALTSRVKLLSSFSLTEKQLENNRKRLYVKCFAIRKDI